MNQKHTKSMKDKTLDITGLYSLTHIGSYTHFQERKAEITLNHTK